MPSLSFEPSEFATRRANVLARMAERGLDGMLLFKQESRYYLTGYDSMAFMYFHCLYLGADGAMTLLCRLPDMRHARFTSVIEDIRTWYDHPDTNPAGDMVAILKEHGKEGARIGVEQSSYGCLAQIWIALKTACANFCTLEDASDLVDGLRVVKSPAELDFVRHAAKLADDALGEGNRLAVPGAFEGDILAAMQGTIFSGGGTFPAAYWVIGSGPKAMLVRYHTGRRHLDPVDQLQLEFAGSYRRYHACLMRTILTGKATDQQARMHEACVEALTACQDVCRPGHTVGEVFDAHARVMDAHGMREHRLNACGYSLGATYAPSWMDWPMFYTGNEIEIVPGMVFFMHMILADSGRQLAMALGETVITTDGPCERLSAQPWDLVVN